MTTHRRLIRFILIALSILVLLGVTAILIIRSSRFHRYALAMIVSRAEQATGGRVEIGDFTFQRAGLRVSFYRVALHGAEPTTAPPLFWADHIGLGLRIVSLLSRDVRLNDLEIDHPVVHLTVDAQGHSNLPQAPGSASGKPTNIFDMAVKYAGISNGDVYYNDVQTPLEAKAQNLKLVLRFVPLQTAYEGGLSYQSGVIHFGTLNPLNHDLETQFTAESSGITLSSLRIRSGSSWISAQGKMTNYDNPAIDGSFQAGLSGADLARVLNDPSLPRGSIEAQGAVKYRNPAGAPPIDALDSSGTVHSALLTLDMSQARARAERFSAAYRLARGNLEVSNLKAGILGGSLTGRLSMTHLGGTPVGKFSADLRNLSLADARRAMRAPPPQAAIISGGLDASLQAAWQGTMQDLQVHSDATLQGSTVPSAAAGSGSTPIPINAALHLDYNGRRQLLTLTNTVLHTPHSTVNVNGSLGQRAGLTVNAQTNDLREIDDLALTLRRSTPAHDHEAASPPQPFGLAGSASFIGTVQGSLSAPQIAGSLKAMNLQYSGANFKTVQGNVSVSPSGAAIHQGALQESAGGSAQFDISAGLRDWLFTPQSLINAQLSAQKFQVADLERLAGRQYPVSGILSTNLSFNGSQTNPAGHGSVQLVKARAWDQPIQNLTVNFQGTETSIHSTLSVNTSAGSLTAKLTYGPKDQSYDLQAQAPAIHLSRLAPLAAGNKQITGTVALTASGRGTVKDPRLKVTLGAQQLHVRNEDLSGLKAEADVANQQAHITLASTVSGASLQAQGDVGLKGEHQAHINIQSQTIQLGPLLAAVVPRAPSGLKGQTLLQASLDGPLSRPEQVQAHVEIPTLSLGYQSFQISAAAPVRLDYRNGVLTLQHTELKGTDTDLRLQGSIPVRAPGAIQMSATGGVDLHLIEVMAPRLNTSGRIDLDVNAQGSRAHPEVKGTVRLTNASALPIGSPIGLESANGELDIGGGRVEIKTLSGQVGGGTLSAHGFAAYSPSVQFNLGLRARGVRLLYPQGVRSETDANLDLTGTPSSALLNGQVFIDRLSLAKGFDLANFAGQFSGSTAVVNPSSLEQNIKLNVAVLSREQMSVESSQLSTQGSVNLQVRGTVAEPVILGRTDIVSGEVFFEGKRFQVQSGVIQFVNPIETEPVVNLVVSTTVQQFNITLNFVGPVDQLRTTYTSSPPLSPVDIINLLVAGHTTEAAQASPTTPQSLLAQGLSSEVSSRVQKLVGISSLTIDPQIGGNQSNAASQLAIQQRVTKNLFFTFATDVTTTQGEVVQVEYQVTPRFSVSAIRDQTGGYQLELKMHKVF